MKFKELYNKVLVSEAVEYHIKNRLTIQDSVFRLGSDAFAEFVCEVRKLWEEDKIELSESDQFIVEKLKTGTKAVTKDGQKVVLDTPERITEPNKKKKFRVWRDSGKKDDDGNIIAKKIEWGDPNMKVKNYDKKAADNFQARHQCDKKNDPDKAGWWACNIARWHKQLGLESDRPW